MTVIVALFGKRNTIFHVYGYENLLDRYSFNYRNLLYYPWEILFHYRDEIVYFIDLFSYRTKSSVTYNKLWSYIIWSTRDWFNLSTAMEA